MGVNTPNIRFKGFTDDWEQCKLSTLCENITVGIANSATHAYRDNGIVMFRNQNIKENYLDDSDIIYIDEEFEKRYINKRLKANDLLIARTGYPGTACVVPAKYEGSQTFTTLIARLKTGTNPFFVCQYINSDYGKSYITATQIGGGQKNSGAGILEQFPMALPPTLDEQITIAEFLTKLDETVTLHQRKCDEVKELKKYMLQKMFPQEGQSVPEIRFDGFTDDWEQRKLNEYLEVSRIKNKDEVYGKEDVLSVSGDNGIVNQIEFQGRSFAGVSVAPYGVVETGDVVYTKSPLKSNPYGIIKTNKGKPGIVSTLYAVYKPLENVYSEFVQIYFEQDARMNNYMHPLVNKGAKNDMKVSAENALKGEVCFPNRDEQINISEYFAKLDNLITLHQRKCDEMKELKKYMLQNMFPQKG